VEIAGATRADDLESQSLRESFPQYWRRWSESWLEMDGSDGGAKLSPQISIAAQGHTQKLLTPTHTTGESVLEKSSNFLFSHNSVWRTWQSRKKSRKPTCPVAFSDFSILAGKSPNKFCSQSDLFTKLRLSRLLVGLFIFKCGCLI
jgi:hypothetical protein